MKNYKNIILSFLIASVTLVACDDIFEVDPEEVLLKEDYLGDDELDARASLFGVLSLMQDATEQYFVWGEMRADLVDVTDQTEDELRQIALHQNDEDNSYLDPTLLYSIVNNCNYGLEGIDTVAYDNDLLDEYVSILRVRTWAQLQIAINFGELPFITSPIESSDDLTKEYPLLSLPVAMDSLINALLPYSNIESIDADDYVSSQGAYLYRMVPNNNILLGELYLWRQNYTMAATYYKMYLDEVVTSGTSAYNLTTSYGIIHSENNGNYTTSNAWENLFSSSTSELIFYTYYTEDYRQYNNLYDNLEEQVIPSEAINLNWSVQENIYDGVVFSEGDFRASVMFEDQNPDDAISKLDTDFYKYDRVSRVYLRLAEAINAAGYPAHALYIINNGLLNESGDYPQFSGNAQAFLNFDPDKYYVLNSSGVATSGNLGIRGRAGLAPVTVEGATSLSDSIKQVDALILNEAALELAFEGTRWPDLVRSALRNNDASIVADAVAAKFTAAGDLSTAEVLRTTLSNSENWFLPLTIPSNFISYDEEEEVE
ncbi:RagB/SusD family nutrient uptake outer membrane protein [Labilibaculum sp.]|uniref:RagB/SusD family nutrient uptake outer membrane protein n=1 Tax=Labilibaculum sp. TaxID=2060723 RepID=UPI003569B2D5